MHMAPMIRPVHGVNGYQFPEACESPTIVQLGVLHHYCNINVSVGVVIVAVLWAGIVLPEKSTDGNTAHMKVGAFYSATVRVNRAPDSVLCAGEGRFTGTVEAGGRSGYGGRIFQALLAGIFPTGGGDACVAIPIRNRDS